MAATTALFHHFSPPLTFSSHKFSILSKRPTNLSFTNFSSNSPLFSNTILLSVPSTETPILDEDEDEDEDEEEEVESQDTATTSEANFRGCKACGRAEIENGCNGEGRIQGGIATVPGFGWWPIKAYRPCPAFVISGGRYRRTGQSMDEVVSGGASRNTSSSGTSDGAKSSKKVKGIKKSKR